jgi:hypothetical protein
LRNASPDDYDSVSWRWTHGPAVDANALGFPYQATDFAFCVYDDSVTTPGVVARASLPAGPACAGARCWRINSRESAASYRDKLGVAGAVGSASLKSGESYKTSAHVKARGVGLAMGTLFTGFPLRVQLQAENGQCWEAVYDADDVSVDDGQLKGATDGSD